MLELQQLPIEAWRVMYHRENPIAAIVRQSLETRTRNSVFSPEFVEFMEQNVINER